MMKRRGSAAAARRRHSLHTADVLAVRSALREFNHPQEAYFYLKQASGGTTGDFHALSVEELRRGCMAGGVNMSRSRLLHLFPSGRSTMSFSHFYAVMTGDPPPYEGCVPTTPWQEQALVPPSPRSVASSASSDVCSSVCGSVGWSEREHARLPAERGRQSGCGRGWPGDDTSRCHASDCGPSARASLAERGTQTPARRPQAKVKARAPAPAAAFALAPAVPAPAPAPRAFACDRTLATHRGRPWYPHPSALSGLHPPAEPPLLPAPVHREAAGHRAPASAAVAAAVAAINSDVYSEATSIRTLYQQMYVAGELGVTPRALRTGMARRSVHLSPRTAAAVVSHFDVDRDGQLSLSEFTKMLASNTLRV